MKLTTHFDAFMRGTIALNKTRTCVLEERTDAITTFVKDNEVFGPHFRRTSRQGSWALGTLIKPSDKKPEFDADVLLFMDKVDGWDPQDYVEELYVQFKEDGRYAEIVARGTRCLTIDYKGEFHLDLVPTIERDIGSFFIPDRRLFITNRKENEWEETDGEGYAEWFSRQDQRAHGKLIPIVQLMKYLRDIKRTFSAKSILLTTLLANQIQETESPDDFDDLPTALLTILGRLNDFLTANPVMPRVANPCLAEEDFVRHWDQEKYDNFREKVAGYLERMTAAFNAPKRDDSIILWRDVFGEEFAAGVDVNAAAVTRFDQGILSVPHRQALPWVASASPVKIPLKVQASRKGFRTWSLRSGYGTVPTGCSLRFEASIPLKLPYKIYWQVTNTGSDAQAADGLRGDFYDGIIDHGGRVRTESTKYKGEHWVECLVVKDGRCVGRSGEFVIKIA